MHFARADTYINVYLPRSDGVDPRRYAASPVFNSENTYKFSDQIVKDRPLFLGRKQMSLYEIYYKDNKDGGPESAADTPVEISDEGNETDRDEGNIESELDRSGTFAELPSVKKVSISLDSKAKKSAKRRNTRRFNEPLNAYITNRKKVQNIKSFNPNETIHRQLTTLDTLSRQREPTFSESQAKIRTLHRLIKKTQSAPPDLLRTPRTLGLPPIVIGNVGLSAAVNGSTSAKGQSHGDGKVSYSFGGRAMPTRLSSKPHTIWRQTTELDRNTPRLLTMNKHEAGQPHRYKIGVGIFN